MKLPRFLNLAASLCMLSCVAIAIASVSSIWEPKFFGVERRWDLVTGSYCDAFYVLGIEVNKRRVASGLENVFKEQEKPSIPYVIVFSRSAFAAPRGGHVMRVSNLALKINGAPEGLSGEERTKLCELIRLQDVATMTFWYKDIYTNPQQSFLEQHSY